MRASQEELNSIKAAMDLEKKVRVFKRYQALYLFLSGKTREEAAEIVGISPTTVSNIHTAYKDEGLKGIPDKPVPGRPARLTLEQQCELKWVILELMFLPPYGPNLNLIEGLWKWLKEKVIYNVFYKTVPEIRKNVHAFLDIISREPAIVIERLCLKL